MPHSNEPTGSANDSKASSLGDGAAKDTPPVGGFKLQQTMLILGAFVLIIGGVLLLLQLFVARNLPEMTEAKFEAAQALWEKNGPASYDMDIDIKGAQPGKVHIEVRDKTPTAMTRDGIAPAERGAWDAWTVPGMFQTLVDEFALHDDPNHKGQGEPGAEVWLRCEFDSRFGYPRTYQRLMTGGGPEVFWHVNKFEPK
jgi:hypothetical protein